MDAEKARRSRMCFGSVVELAAQELGGKGPNAARYKLLLEEAFNWESNDAPTVPGVDDPWGNLVELAKSDDEALFAVVDSLRMPSENQRYCAACMLKEIGRASPQVIEGLKRLLVYKAESVRRAAVAALGKIRPTNGDIVNALVSALRDPDCDVIYDAVDMLIEHACWEPSVLAGLVGATRCPWGLIRYMAFNALDASGSTDPKVVAAALRAQEDTDPDSSTRQMAQRIIARAATRTASDSNSELLKARAVTTLDVRFPKLVEKLRPLVDDERGRTHLIVFHAFWKVGTLRKAALLLGAERATESGIHQGIKYHIAELEKELQCALTETYRGSGRKRLELTVIGQAVGEWIAGMPGIV